MRINFFGGPGAGKSTTTARIFSELKERHYSVEIVNEYVKAWAHQNRPVKKYDQIYLFGKQQQYEYRFLSSGVKNIVTDSPCFLSCVYAAKYVNDEMSDILLRLCEMYDEDHPCTNIFLNRGDKVYHQEGRYQDYEGAKEIDRMIYFALKQAYPDNLIELDYADKSGILEAVLKVVE